MTMIRLCSILLIDIVFLLVTPVVIVHPVGAFTATCRSYLPTQIDESTSILFLRNKVQDEIDDSLLPKLKKKKKENGLKLKFSRCFQRYVVYDDPSDSCNIQNYKHVLKSFIFLDEALDAFPDVDIMKLEDTHYDSSVLFHNDNVDYLDSILAGMGITPSSTMMDIPSTSSASTHNSTTTLEDPKNNDAVLQYLASLAFSSNQRGIPPNTEIGSKMKAQISMALGSRISNNRLRKHTPESLLRNYNRIMDLFTRGRSRMNDSLYDEKKTSLLRNNKFGLAMNEADARRVIANFPQLCLYDIHELEARIQFLLSPLPPTIDYKNMHSHLKSQENDIDWVKLSAKGYGAGLSVEQVTTAVRLVPQFLSLYHEDARKPSMLYFYQKLQVPSEAVEIARVKLSSTFLITGIDNSDICFFALLNNRLGVKWESIQILIHAFPTLTFCDLDPSWELMDKGPIRTQLKESVLNYLRKRFQIGTSEIFGMLKTHPRLSGYGVQNNILPTLDALQTRLNLSSRELRRLITRMPSMIGVSVYNGKESSSLDKKISFFLNEAMMEQHELKKAILKQPSLLQYSEDMSLRPKLTFLIKGLSIPIESVSRIIVLAPSVMGLSLEQNIKPTVNTIMDLCDLSKEQVGNLVVTSPSLLTLSVKRKIEPTLIKLSTLLRISTATELGEIIKRAPRVFLQGVESSLVPKFEMIKVALEEEFMCNDMMSMTDERIAKATAKIIKQNPALLVTTNSILKSRLEKYLQDPDITLTDALKPQRIGRKAKFNVNINTEVDEQRVGRSRPVVQFSKDTLEVINVFNSVEEAANQLNLGKSSIYRSCNQGKLVKGKAFTYAGNKTSMLKNMSVEDKAIKTINFSHKVNKIIHYAPDDVLKVELTEKSSSEGKVNPNSKVKKTIKSDTTISIVAFVAGKAYPTDDINVVRGTRKAGGLAIHFPLIDEGYAEKLKLAASTSFGMIMPETENGSNFKNSLILVGFPFLRPSRNRCELYACHGALKLILQILLKSTPGEIQNKDIHIEICTESSYAWNLLKDNDSLLRWGSAPTVKEFKFDGDGPKELANPDLLHPLSKLVSEMVTGNLEYRQQKQLKIGKSVKIKFSHSKEVLQSSVESRYLTEINSLAKEAAIWQFNRQ